MSLRAVFVVLLLVAPAAGLAAGVDAPIERYRGAAGSGEVGTVRGRAFEERRRPSGPDLPLPGTAVILAPRSDAWLQRVEGIKRGSRDSVDAYRAAAPAVRRAWEAYEKSLWEAGAGDLTRTVIVDVEGTFTFDRVPAGPWIVFASRRSAYMSKTPQPSAPGAFLPFDKLAGYHAVTYWMREVLVEPGAVEAVELTDRNSWFTGVVESVQAPPLPDRPYEPQRR